MVQTKKLLQKFMRQDRGAIVIVFALALPAVVGAVGLGVETGVWYSVKRNLQTAADAAAIAAAYEISSGSRAATVTNTARTDAARNGFKATTGNLTVNSPPLSGAYTADTTAVEIVISEAHPLLLSSLLSNTTSITINSRAVAIAGGKGNACVLALNTSLRKAIEISGNGSVGTSGCIIASNSRDLSSVEITGSAAVTAASLQTVGNFTVRGAASLNTDSPPVTNGAAVSDPYARLPIPSYFGCDQTEFKNTPTDVTTITPVSSTVPYVFCKGLDVKGTLHLQPGLYVVDEGTFNVNAGATITGTGVTIILTSSTGFNHAKYTMNGHANINLSAPTSGTYAGILMYRDRDASNQDNTLNGSAAAVFNGALYFPSSTLKFEGKSSAGSTSCTQLIADTIQITGASSLTTKGCKSAGATLAKLNGARLVE